MSATYKEKYFSTLPDNTVKSFFANWKERPNGKLTYHKLAFQASLVDKQSNASSSLPMNLMNKRGSLFGSIFPSSDYYADDIFLQEQVRSYLCYMPDCSSNCGNGGDGLMPVVILLHGTNETCFDTELLRQRDGSYSWLDLADQQRVILLFAQSRGLKITTFSQECGKFDVLYKYAWQQSSEDKLYLTAMLEDMDSRESVSKYVDCSRLYVIGFSNGGLFTSDLMLNYWNQNLRDNTISHPKYPVAAVCNYMGGVPPDIEQRYKQLDNLEVKVPLKIISGTLDENAPRCSHAYQFFTDAGFQCSLEIIKGQKHEYLGSKTSEIFQFFMNYSVPKHCNTAHNHKT